MLIKHKITKNLRSEREAEPRVCFSRLRPECTSKKKKRMYRIIMLANVMAPVNARNNGITKRGSLNKVDKEKTEEGVLYLMPVIKRNVLTADATVEGQSPRIGET